MSSKLAHAASHEQDHGMLARSTACDARRMRATDEARMRSAATGVSPILLPRRRARVERDESESEATMHSIIVTGRSHQPRATAAGGQSFS